MALHKQTYSLRWYLPLVQQSSRLETAQTRPLFFFFRCPLGWVRVLDRAGELLHFVETEASQCFLLFVLRCGFSRCGARLHMQAYVDAWGSGTGSSARFVQCPFKRRVVEILARERAGDTDPLACVFELRLGESTCSQPFHGISQSQELRACHTLPQRCRNALRVGVHRNMHA